jgi:hypothetical protein
MANLQNITIDDTGFIRLPQGTTAQRPASPVVGMIRFNTSTNSTEFYNGTTWKSFNRSTSASVTGTVQTLDIGDYRTHIFRGSGSITFNTYSETIEYLIVAGGGGGGNDHGGGGGGGGVLQGVFTPVVGTSYTITVGGGGAGAPAVRVDPTSRGTSGQDSSAFGFTAIGGGGGGGTSGATSSNGLTGGSGGGSSGYGSPRNPGLGTTAQGHQGGQGTNNADEYQGGGGGGAGQPGRQTVNPRGRDAKGGSGRPSTIVGTVQWFGGGGGGNSSYTFNGKFGRGGIGGGGRGATNDISPGFNALTAESGEANTGGGGGGGNRFAAGGRHVASSIGTAGSGGSGIVIVKYIRQG